MTITVEVAIGSESQSKIARRKTVDNPSIWRGLYVYRVDSSISLAVARVGEFKLRDRDNEYCSKVFVTVVSPRNRDFRDSITVIVALQGNVTSNIVTDFAIDGHDFTVLNCLVHVDDLIERIFGIFIRIEQGIPDQVGGSRIVIQSGGSDQDVILTVAVRVPCRNSRAYCRTLIRSDDLNRPGTRIEVLETYSAIDHSVGFIHQPELVGEKHIDGAGCNLCFVDRMSGT